MTLYEYDSQGRVIREYSEKRDENGERQSDIWNEYDEMGNLIHCISLNYDTKRESWISYNNKEISEKYVSTIYQDTYVRNTIYEYDENGNCIYELDTHNKYEKSRLVDSWETETFYEYIKDGDIDMKYTYMTEKKQNLF